MYETGCVVTDKYVNQNFDLRVLEKSINSVQMFPKKFKIEPYKIKDQGTIGACVAFALCANRNKLENKELSEGFIYSNREPTHYQGEGMIIEEALQMVTKDGTPPIDKFPILKTYEELKTSFDKSPLLDLSTPNRISSFYEIKDVSFEEKIRLIKWALINLGPVICSVDVYKSFTDTSSSGRVKEYEDNEPYYGSHAVSIIGWTEYNEFIIQNSWGESWGDKGLCYISFSSILFRQFFVIVDYITNDNAFNVRYVLKNNASIFSTKDACDRMIVLLKNLNMFPFDCISYKVNEHYLMISKDSFDTVEKVKVFKNSLTNELKMLFDIMPIPARKVHILIDNNMSDSLADFVIGRFIIKNEIDKELNFTKVNYNGGVYISVKEFISITEAEQFILLLKEVYPSTNYIIFEN